MEDTQKAVNTTESAPVDQVVNTTETDQPSQETTQPTTETTSTPQAGQPSYEAVDEFGVPYKNRAFEWKRKYEDSLDKMSSIVEEAVKNSIKNNTPQQREYSFSELEQFAQDRPEHRPWVEEQKALLLRKQITGEFDQKLKAVETQKQAEVKKQNAFNYVASTYPEIFVKNQGGQLMGVNNQHPMAQQINMLMQDPRFANDPEGLMAAADIAYARVSRLKQRENLVKEQKLKAEVKQLQKQTLVEGGARQGVQAVPEYMKALERAKQTGSIKDAAAAMAAIAKAKREALEK